MEKLPENAETLAISTPVLTAVIVPTLVMPPEKVEIVSVPPPAPTVPPTTMPLPPAEIVPELLTPPAKLEIVRVPPFCALPPTQMPLWDAVIRPLLLMPPAKLEIVTPALSAVPPTKTPFAAPEMVPELVMPPPKLTIVSDEPSRAPILMPPRSRQHASIADAAGEGRAGDLDGGLGAGDLARVIDHDAAGRGENVAAVDDLAGDGGVIDDVDAGRTGYGAGIGDVAGKGRNVTEVDAGLRHRNRAAVGDAATGAAAAELGGAGDVNAAFA